MILDTNAISDLLKNDRALIALLGSNDHHLPVIALGEYRYGLRRSTLRDLLERQLRQFEAVWMVLPIVAETSSHYAKVRDQLREQGTPLPENDVWIAALAVQHGLTVCTRDEHFDRVPHLTRVSW